MRNELGWSYYLLWQVEEQTMKSTCETCGVGNSYNDVVKRLFTSYTLSNETCILPELPIIDIAATFVCVH